jgi:hypothetical protein
MPKQHKLNPGTGAKCSLIIRFAYPKRTGLEKDHRTTCILTKMQTIALNRKQQICFFFEVDGTEYYAAKRYFTVEEEGDEAGFFFPEDAAQRKKEREEEKKKQFVEPKKKWRHSKAKQILLGMLREGTIPMSDDGSMTLEEM